MPQKLQIIRGTPDQDRPDWSRCDRGASPTFSGDVSQPTVAEKKQTSEPAALNPSDQTWKADLRQPMQPRSKFECPQRNGKRGKLGLGSHRLGRQQMGRAQPFQETAVAENAHAMIQMRT